MPVTLRRTAPSVLNVKELHSLIDTVDDFLIKTHIAAKWYAANGIKIIPFLSYGYPKGLSQKLATCNAAKIDKWWHPINGLHPGACIAMAHGGDSGYCAIDLDVKDADGIQNLVDLQAAYGNYDDGIGEDLQTLMALTPSGGRHLIFKYHPEVISNSEASYPGIDTRGGLKRNPVENGGITFVEPSISLKKKVKKGYRWDESITAIRDVPQWLVDVLNGRAPAKSGGIQLQESYIQSAPGLHGDGRDRNIYMDLLRFVGIGYTEDQLWKLMPDILERMDPPDEEMVRRKIESVISSDAFLKSKEEQKTEEQVSTVKLIRDKKDNIIKCVTNLDIILNSPLFDHEYGQIEYDDFTQGFVINKEPMASMVDWSLGIQLWIAQKFKLDFPKTDVRDRMSYIAYSNPHANLAREYMMACPNTSGKREKDFWGSGRLGPGPAFKRLCTEILDLDNADLHPNYDEDAKKSYEAFLWFWLQGVCARACIPGCKMEIVLNIFGSQGIGKSLFFRDLCPDPKWFTDSLQGSVVTGGQSNKDELMKLHAKIIVEMPELNPMKRGGKSSDDMLKQFFSAQVDNFRRPYGTDSIDHLRTCALCGTSNNRDIYRDPSGTRRFASIDHGSAPIKVGDLDTGVMNEIRDKLWGEVVHSFKPGELDGHQNQFLVAIPPELRGSQKKINDSHRFEEIGIRDILDWVSDKTRVTWAELIAFAKTVPGLRDVKESMVMISIRRELSNDSSFEFKRMATRCDENGDKSRGGCWINSSLDLEKNWNPGEPVPPHWSTYSKPANTDENPEY